MGNAILKCFRGECGDDDSPPHHPQYILQSGTDFQFVSLDVAGFNSLKKDLNNFDITSQVPEGLSQRVEQNKKTQAKWYRKILSEWRESNTPPKNPSEASNLIARTLRIKRDTLEGFLRFYDLPLPPPQQLPAKTSAPSKWPEGVKFEIHTLPVDTKLIGDGDGMTVHVDTANPKESSRVPREIQEAAIERRNARAVRNYQSADSLQKIINNAEYRVINGPNNEETLAKDYKIRLRGIDAPEMKMDYGQEAKEALIKLIQNKRLIIQIYEKDRYDRWVGDVYCNGVFIQEKMLRKGCAWHHIVYDKRPEFAQWQREARNAGKGLWANANPIEPWVWKRENNNGRNSSVKKNFKQKSMKKEQGVPIQVY
ncbi:hypothetical protein LUZ60_015393 [Juncus effusus]|nr:hypothetical protein LUZ60_015393 [Juncus effusus]